MNQNDFQEALLQIMEQKQHWAWPAFTTGRVEKALLCIHLEQEYAVYVRDFPIFVGRAYVSCPIPEVRRELIENVYEEETGRVAAGRPHPELFLEYPRGLGFDLKRFEDVRLLPESRAYRAFLDDVTLRGGWDVATSVTTLFVEGTPYERGELHPNAPKRPEPPLSAHPLVRHYGLPVACLELTKAHRRVEGTHRAAAWRTVLDHISADRRSVVTEAMQDALGLWQNYRDGVARACGITRELAAGEKGAEGG